MRLLIAAATLALFAPALAASDDIKTLASVLPAGITEDDVVLKNCAPRDVINPRVQQWDRGKSVCEVWSKDVVIPEQRTPGKPLQYADAEGGQIYAAQKTFQQEYKETITKYRQASDKYAIRKKTREIEKPVEKVKETQFQYLNK
jgi:hypothetical protein